MTQKLILAFAFLLVNLPAFAQTSQKPQVLIRLVSIEQDSVTATITYDLINVDRDRHYNIEAILIDSAFDEFYVKYASGDIGEAIAPGLGLGKKFVVDLTQMPSIRGGVYSINITAEPYRYLSGHRNFMLSVALPGLGDRYVYRNAARGPAITLAFAGLYAGSMLLHAKSDNYYQDYTSSRVQREMNEAFTNARKYNTMANSLRLGALALWAIDIYCVYTKGKRNETRNAELRKQLSPAGTSRVDWMLRPGTACNKNGFTLGLTINL